MFSLWMKYRDANQFTIYGYIYIPPDWYNYVLCARIWYTTVYIMHLYMHVCMSLQEEDVDDDEVECLLANLINEVRYDT